LLCYASFKNHTAVNAHIKTDKHASKIRQLPDARREGDPLAHNDVLAIQAHPYCPLAATENTSCEAAASSSSTANNNECSYNYFCSGSDTEEEDWLLKLGKNQELGREPTNLKDLKHHAGFSELSNSPEYYWEEHKHQGFGLKHLVAKAWGKEPEEISDEEASFTLSLSTLLLKLTEEERKLLARCMEQAINSKDKELSIFKNTNCPYTTRQFDRLYLSGKNAVIPNLPHPVVETTPDGSHAFTRLSDVIANLLAEGTPVEKFHFEARVDVQFTGEPAVSNTPAAYQLYCQLREAEDGEWFLAIHFTRWCDDFDPFNTKTSRNQVWTCTYTICPPAWEHRGRNTYFMAIGAKGDDHSSVEEIFAEELKTMSAKGMHAYHGGLRRIIKVKAGQLLICVDRPERTSLLHIGDHGGSYSVVWGYAGAVDGHCKDNHLPSCPNCRKIRLARLLEGNSVTPDFHNQDTNQKSNAQCNNCSDWNLKTMRSKVPSKFPITWDTRENAPPPPWGRELAIEPDSDGEKRVVTVKYSVPWCKTAVEFAHHNAHTLKPRSPGQRGRNPRFWNKGELTAFLRTCGFTEKTMVDDVYRSAVEENKETYSFPHTWFPDDVFRRTHYAPMHTVFLGDAKTDSATRIRWLKVFEKAPSYGRQANKLLKDVQNLRCRKYWNAHPLSTSDWGTGTYVSENHLFMARAQKFLFILPAVHCKPKNLLLVTRHQKEVKVAQRFAMASHAAIARIMSSEREVPEMDALVKIYLDTLYDMDRLKLPGLDDSDDSDCENAEETREEADITMSEETATCSNDIVPPPAEGEVRNIPVAVAVPTTEGDSQPSNKRKRTKSAPQTQEGSKAKTSKKQPKGFKKSDTVFNKSVSLGLLEAHFSHWYFGPATLHWDGDWKGERKVGTARPLMSLKRENAAWQKISLQRIYQIESLRLLLEKTDGKSPSRVLEGSIKIYENLQELEQCLQENLPISGLLGLDGNVWIAFRPHDGSSRSAVAIQKINFNDTSGELVKGLCWCSPVNWDPCCQTEKFNGRKSLDEFVSEYVLLLPRTDDHGNYMNSYYAMGSKWTERNQSGKFVLPNVTAEMFNDWLDTNIGQPPPVEADVAAMMAPGHNSITSNLDEDVAGVGHAMDMAEI
jgi:hypothetical protein